MDETGILMKQSDEEIVVTKESQHAFLPEAQRRKNATLFFSIFADGTSLDPIMLWPSQTISEDLKELKYHRINCLANGTGWMTRRDFEKVMIEILLPKINEKRVELHGQSSYALIILDGHSSRLSFPVISWCRDHLIHLLILPSHTTHLTQPLDRFVIAHFKNSLKRAFSVPSDSSISSYRKSLIPAVSEAVNNSLSPRIVKKSFEACGIFPLDPSVVYQCLPQNIEAPSTAEKVVNNSSLSCSISMKLITGDNFFESFSMQFEKKKKRQQNSSVTKQDGTVSEVKELSNVKDKSSNETGPVENVNFQNHGRKTIIHDDVSSEQSDNSEDRKEQRDSSEEEILFPSEKRKRKLTSESKWGSIFNYS
ncbi:putative DDE superfamily endonuclease [Monocercomonoides exilis]|uniref:putative DDE superfamily endonuclease n=1 Tax=Monocercomonoides exilis TaxID=2049356 RepID=UPI0035599E02|nr:putative DDE superfamily endonuclease [Monocercomonoides exilis]|eukprot:MONOS_3903.1-p1 / transcript=MONOS_3903.1 / gene=MONOS_3903 / organism=Monocercomonoides_exilis_PA203 / gene_product=unspecified product / transcript_product=unspecified product / location=Mono_scaffold00096:95297-96394(+) / protein_length=365 / sequence_SO=supercontig / SO=protein_coding / is_pseudo=false